MVVLTYKAFGGGDREDVVGVLIISSSGGITLVQSDQQIYLYLLIIKIDVLSLSSSCHHYHYHYP